MAKLTSTQYAQLQAALQDSFSRAELERMVRIGLGENLAGIAGGSNDSEIVFDLISWAERRGRVHDLVRCALAERPDNTVLMTLAGELSADRPESPDQPATNPSTSPGASGWAIGTIHATNVTFGDQNVDQRGADITVGDKHINTDGGAYVQGDVTVSGGDFVGRDKVVKGDDDSRPAVIRAFTRLAATVVLQAPTADVEQATKLVADMQQAFVRGDDANVADCIGALVKLAPTIKDTLKQVFSQPPLDERAGPAAKDALRRLG